MSSVTAETGRHLDLRRGMAAQAPVHACAHGDMSAADLARAACAITEVSAES